MKPKGIYWEAFKKIHSPGTSAWIENNFGHKILLEEFLLNHKITCGSKKYSARVCGKDLYQFLTKYNWLKKDAE